jgi:hypothetical protein
MNTNGTTTLKMSAVAALAAMTAMATQPAEAVGKKAPTAETAAAVARAVEHLPGPLAGTTVELSSVTQADVERLQALSDAFLWLPEQGKARFFSSRSSAFAGDTQAKVLAPAEDVSQFLARIATDVPDLTSGRWVLMSPVRIEAPAAVAAQPRKAPASSKIQGEPSPNAAFVIFSEQFNNPISGNWDVTDNKSGAYQWGRSGCSGAYSGSYSANPYAGGTSGPFTICGATYPNSFETWMYRNAADNVYGAVTATLGAYVEVNTQSGADYLIFVVPTTPAGYAYVGPAFSGNNPGVWQHVVQDLRAWPGGVGDLTTRTDVGLALVFRSDATVTYGTGARVDDISIAISTGGGVTPGCSSNATTLCLFSNRFQVKAQYDSYGAPSTFVDATATSVSDNTGYFTTALAGNVDVIVKMVNFCSVNNTWSVYIGGTTDLGVNIQITDKNNPSRSVYNASNSINTLWTLIREVAFPCP